MCASLPLYFGGELRGGGKAMRRVLVASVLLVGGALLVAAIPLAAVPDALREAAVPGAAIAQAYSGRALAVTVGLLTAGGTLALVVAEYLALARLLRWLHGIPLRTSYAWIAIPFLALDAISLLSPDRFYDDLIKPSLGALFVSQLVVFARVPALPARRPRARPRGGRLRPRRLGHVHADRRDVLDVGHTSRVPATVIVGAQWGDEGKGKIVDLLAQHSDLVCRYQGGPNAGHTIVVGDETYKIRADPDAGSSPASRA